MTDIATTNTAPGPYGLGFDWLLAGPALQSDDGLYTAVIISLFSDRVAAADDQLPDNSGDRRGCWSDMPLDNGVQDPIGSRLWLLARAKSVAQTAANAQNYALEALQWLKTDGVADEVDASATWITDEQLLLSITITRQVGNATLNHRWDFVWNMSAGAWTPSPAN